MTPALVGRLLWFRVRAQWPQLLLMISRIAIGVALVFAVLTANGSIAKSSDEIIAGIVGDADLQLQARDQHGFDERVERLVAATPGVSKTATLLDQRAVVSGPRGLVPVNVASASARSVAMSPSLAGSILSLALLTRSSRRSSHPASRTAPVSPPSPRPSRARPSRSWLAGRPSRFRLAPGCLRTRLARSPPPRSPCFRCR